MQARSHGRSCGGSSLWWHIVPVINRYYRYHINIMKNKTNDSFLTLMFLVVIFAYNHNHARAAARSAQVYAGASAVANFLETSYSHDSGSEKVQQ